MTGKQIVVRSGRFGPYVTDGETNASLRRGDDPETVTLERAVELLAERRAKGPAKPRNAVNRSQAPLILHKPFSERVVLTIESRGGVEAAWPRSANDEILGQESTFEPGEGPAWPSQENTPTVRRFGVPSEAKRTERTEPTT